MTTVFLADAPTPANHARPAHASPAAAQRWSVQAVQELLDLYKKCSPAERAEFTPEQNSGLRAYFDALYNVQGKDKAELDDLFAGRSVASSAPASSASAAASSSAAASW